MFDKKIYVQRRYKLKKQLKSGLILFPGNEEPAMNYASNTYDFRQDSSFLYFFGVDQADLFGVIDIDNDEEIIYGNEFDIYDIIWMGQQTTIREKAAKAGIRKTEPVKNLSVKINDALKKGVKVHYLPQYRYKIINQMSWLLGISPDAINNYTSSKLIEAVIAQRSKKIKEEVDEIEYALDIAYEMHTVAMKMAEPGMIEQKVAGAIEGIAKSMGPGVSFPPIVSIHGEILHNHHHENKMKKGDLMVNDSGAESYLHYASDITRTFPVDGKFTSKQKEIYEIVLNAQLNSIKAIKPGRKFRDVHLLAARNIAVGLKELGFMKGDTDEAIKAGAHALFFPHGLGHMLGLDVHDMEGLGEDFVGYNEKIKRSDQFGLAYVRLAKELEPGYVLTVEPGIYFIPELIDLWRKENKFKQFINYDKADSYIGFGGIRIEDNVLVTGDGHRVLGRQSIPKTIDEVERMCVA
ncbi:MAG TPA: aminopeptidase P family protein [Ignavibacteriaceae bacterium]|nr:aminopeptidase P family protein [Ignavibacteriaceae bacterium]